MTPALRPAREKHATNMYMYFYPLINFAFRTPLLSHEPPMCTFAIVAIYHCATLRKHEKDSQTLTAEGMDFESMLHDVLRLE